MSRRKSSTGYEWVGLVAGLLVVGAGLAWLLWPTEDEEPSGGEGSEAEEPSLLDRVSDRVSDAYDYVSGVVEDALNGYEYLDGSDPERDEELTKAGSYLRYNAETGEYEEMESFSPPYQE